MDTTHSLLKSYWNSGFHLRPYNDVTEQSTTTEALDDPDGDSSYNNCDAFKTCRKEQEKSISVGTPPPASSVPPKRSDLRSTRKRFSYSANAANEIDYKSDLKDGAIAHTEDAKARDDVS
ncbi:MAG: hypothetical protein Q9166_008000, partial [cf. Caloplaca sp. 2 TL-2023]